MLRQLSVVLAAALCAGSYAMAASPSIGSVTSRGELKIDNFAVNGSGTLFDGSVIETGETSTSIADLRLGHDVAISLSVDSRGTLRHDRFELQRGMVEISSTSSFRVNVNGLNVAPLQAHSSGFISIEPENSVKIVAETGDLEVKGPAGRTIALVHPGHPLTFNSFDGTPSNVFTATGVVSSENGRYYFRASETDVKYELKGDNLQSYNGSSVVASGTLDSSAVTKAGVAGLIQAKSIDQNGAGTFTFPPHSVQSQSLVGGLSIGAATPSATVSGAGGGTCQLSVELRTPCCPPPAPSVGPFCCPGFLYPSNKCHHSH